MQLARCSSSPTHRGQSGQVLLMVVLMLGVLLGVGALAIDTGLLRVAHGGLESAANGAALAGAATLRNQGGEQARICAARVVRANRAPGDRLRPVRLTAEDFRLAGPARVQVTLGSDAERGGGVRALFAPVLGLSRSRSVFFTAIAETIELCATDSCRPIAIPDRWRDLNGNGLYEDGEPYASQTTGYQPQRDEGLVLRLRPHDPRRATPPSIGSYLAVRLPAVDGGQGNPRAGRDSFRRHLERGAPVRVRLGECLQLETEAAGAAVGELLGRLVARDRLARWQPAQAAVVGSGPGLSPRVIKVLLVDPRTLPATGPAAELRITRLAAAYLEEVLPDGELALRLVPLACDGIDCPSGVQSFLYRTRLVPAAGGAPANLPGSIYASQ